MPTEAAPYIKQPITKMIYNATLIIIIRRIHRHQFMPVLCSSDHVATGVIVVPKAVPLASSRSFPKTTSEPCRMLSPILGLTVIVTGIIVCTVSAFIERIEPSALPIVTPLILFPFISTNASCAVDLLRMASSLKLITSSVVFFTESGIPIHENGGMLSRNWKGLGRYTPLPKSSLSPSSVYSCLSSELPQEQHKPMKANTVSRI